MTSGDWTAIGTIALAVATLIAVLTTIVITAQDRRGAAARLASERAHSDKQLADERAFSQAQLEEERRIARDREQWSEAYAVQVALGERSAADPGEGAPPASRLGGIVVNHGHYTITGIEARIRLAGGGGPSLVPFAGSERVPCTADLDERLRNGMSGLLEALMHSDRLSPWDIGLRFWSDPISSAQFPGAYPVVRWTDRWGTRWEHRLGQVRQIEDGQEWVP